MATGTTSETSNTINYIEKTKGSVWHVKMVHSFVTGQADATTRSFQIPKGGVIRHVNIVVSGASGANPTATVLVNDDDNIEVFSKSDIAESTTDRSDINKAIDGTIDVVVTPSTDPLSAYSVTTTIRGVR